MNILNKIVTAGLLASAAAAAQAADHRVTVVNATPSTMMRLFASPTTGRAIDEDMLGDTIVKPGQSVQLVIGGGGDACLYTLKASFDDGTTKVREKVNVCEIRTYRFTAQ